MSDNDHPERSPANRPSREIEELLPWRAAGTLDPATARRVEEALAREPALRDSLNLAREDREETIALNEELGAPSGQAWARVLATARAEPKRAGLASLAARAAAWLGAGTAAAPRRLAWVGAAAALVIALQSAALVALLASGGEATYRAASGPSTASEGATVIVAFAPDARIDQIAELLRRRGAVIVDGPRAGGLFRLRIGDKTMAKDQVEAVVASLRAEPIVRMALLGPQQ